MLFGSVYPWAYRLAELMCFALFALWMVKLKSIAGADSSAGRIDAGLLRALRVPCGILVLFVGFQLIPLPPAMLQAISPSTYRFYRQVYPGWPSTAPHESLNDPGTAVSVSKSDGPVILPTEDEVRRGAAIPFAPVALNRGEIGSSAAAEPAQIGRAQKVEQIRAAPEIYARRWRPLSIAWPLTIAALIGALALIALFFATIFYPAGAGREVKEGFALTRVLMLAILASGVIVALAGLANWGTWNGKILWVMVPYDWGAPNLGEAARRACGPFVNPDHFAGYLAMIFPLALAGLIFGGFPARSSSGLATRVMYGFATFVIFVAVALSQSRAGWIGLGVGASLMIALVHLRSRDRVGVEGETAKANPLTVSVGILAALAVLALIFAGQQGREQTIGRFGDTVLHGGLDLRGRYSVWARTPQIVREFPLFGVGMGAWPEIFFRFQPPPRTGLINNAAHNDYLEMMVDAGVVGVALLGWLMVRIAARLRTALRSAPTHLAPAMAAIIAGLIVMSIIELVDFDLHIPANLILFTMLAALGLRIGAAQSASGMQTAVANLRRWIYGPAIATAMVLGIVAMRQHGAPYPYDIGKPRTIADARNLLLSYSGNPSVHESILARFGSTMTPAARSREIATWAWLDPTSPRARDSYAQDLLDRGRRADAMNEIGQSTYVAPDSRAHPYMSPRLLPWLADDQRRAIEKGLGRAVADGFRGSVLTLGEYYAALGRTADRANLFVQAASNERDRQRRAQYLREAGDAYAATGEPRKAGELFERAIEADPDDAQNYAALIAGVLVPHEEYERARSVIEQGIANQVDACRLELSVAIGAQQRGRRDIAEQALNRALEIDAESYDCTIELGRLYDRDQRYARAMIMMDTATRLKPDSAEAYLELAAVAEKNYDYSAAGKAYERAAALAPQNQVVAQTVAAFKRKLADAADSELHKGRD
ncbi:MAG: O-antigen ligase family protein [Candidatus Binatus sp.]|uniref:O-antigen ligase family protein n=1 Tax=Candidatus Binatus sp. TaxID=2811406 RepID=UPI00271D1F43|nr:O-antigen ligase family protein [Candidatus Binatus sp.]MDO8431604.1 O-antigen ligase family protein [Candidatus Binatus sp.]